MNTLSLRYRYRPMRIGFCVETGDLEGFRRAVRLSFTMWGGSFNPIIPIGNTAFASGLAKLFRVDALYPTSDTSETKNFKASQKHIPWPLSGDDLFEETARKEKRARVVDLHHPILRLHEEHFRNNAAAANGGIDLAQWDADDPLADVLLCSFGGTPAPQDIGIDYEGLAREHLFGKTLVVQKGIAIPPLDPTRMTLSQLNRAFIKRHYSVQNHWGRPGFYIGDATNFEDLVNFWNLRAADIQVSFFDPDHAVRFDLLRANWVRAIEAHQAEHPNSGGVALWHRRARPLDALEGFGSTKTDCAVDDALWNGLNVKAPIMYFGEGTALAAVSDNGSAPRISFSLTDRPFTARKTNYHEHFVLSVAPGVGLFGNEDSTLHVPFIPALNEYYGRKVHHSWRGVRAEPGSIGLILDAATDNVALTGLNIADLIGEIFRTNGIAAKPSKPGLVARSLIRQMGGLDGCRPFKIAGVRSLIENHSPDQSFSRATAMQVINGQNADRPLSEYQWLYIEPRPHDAALTNSSVLGYLLDKAVFRAGLNFRCSNCQLEFWLSLDDAKSRVECPFCGNVFNSGAQLRDKGWAFRRSGLFGRNDHQEGALPVSLTLQQLNRDSILDSALYTTAHELRPLTAAIPECETDFVVLTPRGRDHRIQIAIGECKTRQPITKSDVEHLRSVADAFPTSDFDVFIVFSKLSPFSPEEVALIRTLNDGDHHRRVIMFTTRELEPYFIYERTEQEFEIRKTAVSLEDMAENTDLVFFQERRKQAPGNKAS